MKYIDLLLFKKQKYFSPLNFASGNAEQLIKVKAKGLSDLEGFLGYFFLIFL